MTNVFTRRNHRPRTITLMDFTKGALPPVRVQPERLLSPTRRGNPHPQGLINQHIPSKSTFLIWHPNFRNKLLRSKAAFQHTKKVNFTCLSPSKTDLENKVGKIPVIKYTENTESRCSYKHPSRFPDLVHKTEFGRFGYNNQRTPVRGIVPHLTVKAYLPKLESLL